MEVDDRPPDSVKKVWREEFLIRSYDIGASKFASPQSICRFLQEAASNHAAELWLSADTLAERGQMWVLSHLTLNMQIYPQWKTTIFVTTWPVGRGSRLRAYRDFLIHDEHGQEIGRASTMWLLLNKESKRPIKLPSWLEALTSSGLDVLSHDIRENEFTGEKQQQAFSVRNCEIDWNLHVNNVCYLEWALEPIPLQTRLNTSMTSLDIQFLAEAKFGDTVLAECYFPTRSNRSYHRILDAVSGKTLSQCSMLWQSIN